MNLQEIKLLFAFNAWASNRLFDAAAALPPDQLQKDLQSSHGSIHNTLVHLVGAEKMWVSRWQGRPDAAFLQASEAPTLEKLRTLWNTVGFESAKFVASINEKKLQEVLEFRNAKGESLRQLFWHSMLHVVDHSTYHRGQVVVMMRQLGATPPATGMIGFFRETAKLGKAL